MKDYFIRIGIAISVLLNVIFGGYSNQTLSARNYDFKKRGRPHIVPVIDKLFFWDHEHCKICWIYWITRKK
jgi:hypothetical protein